MDCFIGQLNCQRSPVRVRIRRYACDPQLSEGAYDSHSDLAAIRYQYLTEHRSILAQRHQCGSPTTCFCRSIAIRLHE
jgi:hypothetical protein